MQYHFMTKSWEITERSRSSEQADHCRSDIVLACDDQTQKISVANRVSSLNDLDPLLISPAHNPIAAKQISVAQDINQIEQCIRLCPLEGLMDERDARRLHDVFRQAKSRKQVSFAKMKLESRSTNGTLIASNISTPICYSHIETDINLLCILNGGNAIELSFSLGSPNSAADRAQDLLRLISTAAVYEQIIDIDQDDVAITPRGLSQIIELLLFKITTNDSYRQYCADKLRGLSVVDNGSLFLGSSFAGTLFDGYGTLVSPASVTDEAFNCGRPAGLIEHPDIGAQIPGRSLAMIADVPFGVPGWVDLSVKRSDSPSLTPKWKVIATSSIIPLPMRDKASLTALVQRCDRGPALHEIRTLSFSITELLKHVRVERGLRFLKSAERSERERQ